MKITFDDSVPAFAQILVQAGLDISSNAGVLIRDSRGRLSFIAKSSLSPDVIAKVIGLVDDDLRPYVSPIGAIADQTAPGAKRVLQDEEALLLNIHLPQGGDSIRIKFLDRRAVGADWLHAPTQFKDVPPLLVFASLKGGVGRSTALCVLAAELAERGRALLVLDLDMEAPGVGSMLISPDATPRFGSIDFFVENSLRAVDDDFILDCVGASWLGGGRGRVDVVPSFGSKSLDNPGGVLSKLARAYLESATPEGQEKTFLLQVQTFVRRLTKLSRYDAVLIDSRAGLHETTAAPILGLGADILLFGVDQRQTIIGYDILLSNLSQFPIPNTENDWRYRLRMVQSKATPDEKALAVYRAKTFDLFDSKFYDQGQSADVDILQSKFRFGIDDADAPHFPIPIFEDDRYRLFDPVGDKTQLARDFYNKSFGVFIEFCLERLQLNEDGEP